MCNTPMKWKDKWGDISRIKKCGPYKKIKNQNIAKLIMWIASEVSR